VRQRYMELIGSEGCYLLSLVRAAEILTLHRIDAVWMYEEFQEQVTGGLKWVEEDCFMNRPDLVLGYMAGGRWSVAKGPADYIPLPGEVVVTRYERKTPSKTWGHFILTSPEVYDPLGVSTTVSQGQPVSTRIFRRT